MAPIKEKIWASLITNLDYLPGLLTLHHSLRSTNTAYPFVALHTPQFPPEGLTALHDRGIRTQRVDQVHPGQSRAYAHDPRFHETWSKLVVFSLGEYERIVLLDGDMLVRRNMDELMDVPLSLDGGEAVFAASHACACNPMKKPHYPATWIPANCAFTTQHATPAEAQTTGAPADAGVGMLNSGLLVVRPSTAAWEAIQAALNTPERTDKYDFPDQELLSDVFRGRWLALPYVYNALKTMRWRGVHDAIWRDEEVRNVHYIFAKKPWHEDGTDPGLDETNRWWWEVCLRRREAERAEGITDGF
ncbi:glycosyl transferase family protein [Aspergillus ambiguus]|uniref:glycosyltransferase family 8 protein n=1 Tax=Aspergillus ambiguus TaxID=176160 RepID=UPI003CCDCF7B